MLKKLVNRDDNFFKSSLTKINTSLLLSLTFTLKIVNGLIFPLQTLDKRMMRL